jgi:Outer membrane protein beta-barrel domain
MKKVLLVTFLAVSAGAAFAQTNINKGAWMVGGNASFASEKQGDFKSTNVGFSPNAGYFFMNQFAGGLRTGITSAKSDFGTSEATTSTWSVAPFLRYYILPASQKINVFADASYGFGSTTQKVGTTKTDASSSNFSIMAGPALFLTPNTAMELTIGYQSTKYQDVDDRDNTIAVGIGFQIHLGGKK